MTITNRDRGTGQGSGTFPCELFYSDGKQYVTTAGNTRSINFSSPADKARHDEMVARVEAMLDAKQQLSAARTDRDKTYYENKCVSLDRQIDRLVYDLYGLTEEEIEIVEGAGK